MPAVRRYWWPVRILLAVPAILCCCGSVFPREPLLSRSSACRWKFQIAYGCLLFGSMPDAEVLDRWDAAEAKRRRMYAEGWVCILPPDEVLHETSLMIAAGEAQRRGVATNAVFGGLNVAVALWLVAIPLFALAMPLLAPLRHMRRQARRRKQNRCVGCGYSLRGLTVPRCPECGLGLEAPENIRFNMPPPAPPSAP